MTVFGELRRPAAWTAAVFLALSLLHTGARAAMYSHEDADGVVHITDRPKGAASKLLLTTLKRPKGFKEPVATGAEYGAAIDGQASRMSVPVPLVMAIIKTESNFNPSAVSPKGARGLMQLMPGTWRMYGVTDPFNVEQNIRAGTAYYREMLNRFGSHTLALAAYNAGPGRVEQYKGVPPFDETQRYIKKVFHYYEYYKNKKNLTTLPGVSDQFDSGFTALRAGQLVRAAENFRRVVRTFPRSPEANYNLALAYDRTGEISQAAEYYRRTLKYDPYFKEAYYNLAILYERLGRNDQAISTWSLLLRYEVRGDERRDVQKYINELRQLARQ